MRLRGIRLVEQAEQNFRRTRVCLKEKEKKKTVSVVVGLFYYIKAPTTKRQSVTGIEPVTYWKMTRRANQQWRALPLSSVPPAAVCTCPYPRSQFCWWWRTPKSCRFRLVRTSTSRGPKHESSQEPEITFRYFVFLVTISLHDWVTGTTRFNHR